LEQTVIGNVVFAFVGVLTIVLLVVLWKKTRHRGGCVSAFIGGFAGFGLGDYLHHLSKTDAIFAVRPLAGLVLGAFTGAALSGVVSRWSENRKNDLEPK
jgi:hypothetical protein